MKYLIPLFVLFQFSSQAQNFRLGFSYDLVERNITAFNDININKRLGNPSYTLRLKRSITPRIHVEQQVSLGSISNSFGRSADFKGLSSMVGFRPLAKNTDLFFSNGFNIEAAAGISLYAYQPTQTELDAELNPMILGSVLAGFRFNRAAEIFLEAKHQQGTKNSLSSLSIGLFYNLGNRVDLDGDGILDKNDLCPAIAGDPENGGCPLEDIDRDGFLNLVDRCPDVPGSLFGCPDQDRDSIPDFQDSCKYLPGIMRLNGCPETSNDSVRQMMVFGGEEMINETLLHTNPAGQLKDVIFKANEKYTASQSIAGQEGLELVGTVYFSFSDDQPEQKPIEQLRQLAQLIKQEPEAKIHLVGHADNIGSLVDNITLSDRRAMAVRIYLVSAGFAPMQIEHIGLGEQNPVADNLTARGRALNRRVEIFIEKP